MRRANFAGGPLVSPKPLGYIDLFFRTKTTASPKSQSQRHAPIRNPSFLLFRLSALPPQTGATRNTRPAETPNPPRYRARRPATCRFAMECSSGAIHPSTRRKPSPAMTAVMCATIRLEFDQTLPASHAAAEGSTCRTRQRVRSCASSDGRRGTCRNRYCRTGASTTHTEYCRYALTKRNRWTQM